MPHSTMGYQLYKLMFGYGAPTSCDNRLGLTLYHSSKFVSKTSYIKEQELLRYAKRQVLKSIQQHAKKSAQQKGDKELNIPEGNLILLQDHPKGNGQDPRPLYRSEMHHG